MAIVKDLAGTELPGFSPGALDNSFAAFRRTNAGTPIGVLTPAYRGEIAVDTTTGTTYMAIGLTNVSWAIAVVEM